MTVPGKHGVNFYICLGVNIENDPYDFAKVSLKHFFVDIRKFHFILVPHGKHHIYYFTDLLLPKYKDIPS